MSNHIKTNWAYLAGFLDADGSIYIRVKPNDTYRYGFQIAPSVVFFQSIKEQKKIRRIQQEYGIGYIRERKDKIIEWIVGDQKSIRFLIEKTLPFLVIKKPQAQLMLDVLKRKTKVRSENDFVNLIEKIDVFETLNYSKKRNIKKEKVLAHLKLKLDIKLKEKKLLAP